jgi:hypothetical protein
MADLIRQTGVIDRVRGFATNVSNYQASADEFAYAASLSSLLGGAHAIVDTSRNGAATSDGEWCNPPGQLVGDPGGMFHDDVVDTNLWIKPPGESDGECAGGPAAGVYWPEAGVAERRAQALWALSRWRQRTPELVLSYPETEGDIHHRPTALPGLPASAWEAGGCAGPPSTPGSSSPAQDQHFPALTDDDVARPLTGGERRLAVQQECPFRAQAQWRLAARAPDPRSSASCR